MTSRPGRGASQPSARHWARVAAQRRPPRWSARASRRTRRRSPCGPGPADRMLGALATCRPWYPSVSVRARCRRLPPSPLRRPSASPSARTWRCASHGARLLCRAAETRAAAGVWAGRPRTGRARAVRRFADDPSGQRAGARAEAAGRLVELDELLFSQGARALGHLGGDGECRPCARHARRRAARWPRRAVRRPGRHRGRLLASNRVRSDHPCVANSLAGGERARASKRSRRRLSPGTLATGDRGRSGGRARSSSCWWCGSSTKALAVSAPSN